jgi:gluconolactonase
MVRKMAILAAAMALTVLALPAQGGAAKHTWPESAERIVHGLRFTEGPAWSPKGFLLFSDIPANRIYRWEEGQRPRVFREPSHHSNGLAFDKEGRLLACEHSARRVTRTELNGTLTILAERFEGKRLNSPNDLTVHSDGSIYFTDPPYGLRQSKGKQELDFQGVFRIAPDGKLTLLIKDMVRPNGIALSPDEKLLYVDDSQQKIVNVYEVRGDGFLVNGRLLIDLDQHGTRVTDGMKVDVEGTLYVTGSEGVYVVSPEGKLLAKILCEGGCTNCCFAGPDRKTLFITGRSKQGGALYRVRVPVPGHVPK